MQDLAFLVLQPPPADSDVNALHSKRLSRNLEPFSTTVMKVGVVACCLEFQLHPAQL